MNQEFTKRTRIFTQLIYASLIGVSVSLLPSCGGGGGGGGSTAPAVATVDPAGGETSVERAVVITATFVDPIVDSDIDNLTFTLVDDAANAVAGAVNSVSDIATFDPDSDLGVLRTYTASLSNTIEKEAGGPISGMSWSFTTRDGVWGSAAAIETDDIASNSPSVAVGPGGVVIAVWQNNADIFANIYNGTSWGTAEAIEATNLGVSDLELAVDANGNAMAVWAHYTGAGSINDIRAAYYDTSAMPPAWTEYGPIDTGAEDARYPKVAFDASGNAVVVWLQSDGTAASIYSARFEPSGAGWGTPETIESSNGIASAPDISVDDGGDALAVWTQDNLAGYVAAYAAYYTAGGSWVEQGEIGENAVMGEDASNVTIAQDGDGNAMAIWHQLSSGAGIYPTVWANRYTGGNGGSWGTATPLENTVNGSQLPKIAFDSHGNAMATWVNWDGSSITRVRTNIYSLNTGWGTTVNADTGTDHASYPDLAVDSEGHAIILWRQNSNAVTSIWANRYQSGGSWGTPELLETSDLVASGQDVAIDSQGNAFGIWTQVDPMATQNKVWVNRFE